MDGRRNRTEATRFAIVSALERLKAGNGNHPRHAGLNVRITRQAVAREAQVSSATLYRFPDLVALIRDANKDSTEQRLRPAEQRRTLLLAEISERDRRIEQLLCQNYRLMTELAKYDKALGEKRPTDIGERRNRKSGKSEAPN